MLTLYERGSPDYEPTLQRLAQRGDEDLARVETNVRGILDTVRRDGDAALYKLTQEIDGRRPEPLSYDRRACAQALENLPGHLREALELSARRIHAFHTHQVEQSRRFLDADGVELGWRVRPLARVGVYAPGGKARYPSSVLMSVIPARVAGVGEVLVTTPRPTDEVLAAAALAGADRVFDLGGAIAVAALAFGTESVPRVDKIVGPGNLYVTAAKKLVYGRVAIDGLAGPSEILVLADEQARPEVVAADLLSQAEHDEAAYPLLVTLSKSFADRVLLELEAQLRELPRRAIAEQSVRTHGVCFIATDLDEACRIANLLAAEHLSLQVREPELALARIANAGAAFLGDHTPEAAGDYLAGPSHVLPTGGAVRFAAPLGVYDFLNRTSTIRYSVESLRRHGEAITTLARMEGLEAHARAVTVRLGTS